MLAQRIDDERGGKDPWPEPPPDPPSGHPAGPRSAHTLAFAPNGLGQFARAPVITVLTPDHSSAPA
jgi:hypothetical protein